MKFIISIIISAVVCYMAQTMLPIWWLFAVITFMVAVLFQLKSGWQHFFAGFIPVFAVWVVLFFMRDAPNNSILSDKIAALFSMPNHTVLFIVAGVIMGLIGGLTGVAGGSFRRKKSAKRKSVYR